MATFNYARAVQTASRLIALFGADATLLRASTSGPAYDPVTTETEHACVAVALTYSLLERATTLVQEGDRRILISTAGLTITPTTADRLTFGGVTYSLQSVDPLSPASTVLLWEVRARA